jgi:hypothetical protein
VPLQLLLRFLRAHWLFPVCFVVADSKKMRRAPRGCRGPDDAHPKDMAKQRVRVFVHPDGRARESVNQRWPKGKAEANAPAARPLQAPPNV